MLADLHMRSPNTDQASVLSADTPIALLIDALQESDKDHEKSSWAETWGLGLSLSLMAIGFCAYLVHDHLWKQPFLVFFALGAMVVGEIGAVICSFSGARTTWAELKRFDHEMLSGAAKRLSNRYVLAKRIAERFDEKQIAFAKDYLQSVCAHMRSRIGLMIGALDKVGIIPLAVSSLVALVKVYGNGAFAGVWYAGAFVLLLFYVGSMKMLGTAYTIERFVVVLTHAEGYALERSASKSKHRTRCQTKKPPKGGFFRSSTTNQATAQFPPPSSAAPD